MEIEDVRKKKFWGFERTATTVMLSREHKLFLEENDISISLLVREAIDELKKKMEAKV